MGPEVTLPGFANPVSELLRAVGHLPFVFRRPTSQQCLVDGIEIVCLWDTVGRCCLDNASKWVKLTLFTEPRFGIKYVSVITIC